MIVILYYKERKGEHGERKKKKKEREREREREHSCRPAKFLSNFMSVRKADADFVIP